MKIYQYRLVNLILIILLTTSGDMLYPGSPIKDIEKKSRKIHDRVFTVDSHTDTPFYLSEAGFDFSGASGNKEFRNRVDLLKMKQGGLDGVFLAVFVGQGQRSDSMNAVVKQRALTQFDTIHRITERFPELARIALSPGEAFKNEEKGLASIFIGIENGYVIGKDLSLIHTYYDHGARYITLCHSKNNDICDSSTDEKGPEHGGLSAFGEEVVREMNRTGMMIDVSHVSDESFYDILKISDAPVIASHSDARALCDHPRNLTDDMLIRLGEHGGVIQICFFSAYVREQAPDTLASVADMVDHIDHVVNIAGIDHVGIGSDFDGGGGLSDCQDVSQMENVTRELVRRGYSEEDIRKIWGGNLMRVFSEVRRIAGITD